MSLDKIGTVGHVDHGKTTLTAAMVTALTTKIPTTKMVDEVGAEETILGAYMGSSLGEPESYIFSDKIHFDTDLYTDYEGIKKHRGQSNKKYKKRKKAVNGKNKKRKK